jgi:hypothetical protein
MANYKEKVTRIKEPETYWEEKTDKLLGHLQKRTNKKNVYKVDTVEDKIFREEITTKSQIDKEMGYTPKKKSSIFGVPPIDMTGGRK